MAEAAIRTVVVAASFARRAALRDALQAAGADVVSDAASWPPPDDGVTQPDLVVTDDEPLGLISARGVARLPPLLVISADAARVRRRLERLGVSRWGIVRADPTPGQLRAAIGALRAGLLVMPRARDAAGNGRSEDLNDLAFHDDAEAGEPAVEALTPREREVLESLAEGLSNRAIAVRLGISAHTVKFHVSSIYGKLGAASRADAVRVGIRRGLISI